MHFYAHFLKNENIDSTIFQGSLKTLGKEKRILLGHILLERNIHFIPFYQRNK